jgi:hypothetical protein
MGFGGCLGFLIAGFLEISHFILITMFSVVILSGSAILTAASIREEQKTCPETVLWSEMKTFLRECHKSCRLVHFFTAIYERKKM